MVSGVLRWLASAMAVVLVLAGAAYPAPAKADLMPVWSPVDGSRLVFDVYRDGGKFGSHTVAFQKQGDQLTVKTDIELRAGFGPLTLFHYIHDATETWVNGRLKGVDARTRSDGRWKNLTVEATLDGLKVAGAAFRGMIASEVIPSSHWNIEQMRQSEMLSTETGEMLPMQVIDQGVERIRTGSGEVDARRFLVKSQMDATFWYDAQGRWVKTAFRTRGSDIEYVLRELPA